MAGELYRTYEVLVEETVHPDHPKTGLTFVAFRRGLFFKKVQQLCEKYIGTTNSRRLKA